MQEAKSNRDRQHGPWLGPNWVLAFYELDYSLGPSPSEIVVGLADYLGAGYNRVEITGVANERPIRSKLNWPSDTQKLLKYGSTVSTITMEKIFRNNFETSTISLTCDVPHRMLTAHAPAATETHRSRSAMLIDAAKSLRPGYGFTNVVQGNIAAIGWPRGVSDVTSSASEALALSTLSMAIEDPTRPLLEKIHDVYNENILSLRHLAADVGGYSLETLISNRGLGGLTRLTDDLFIWEMADSDRKRAHSLLSRGDLLLAEKEI